MNVRRCRFSTVLVLATAVVAVQAFAPAGHAQTRDVIRVGVVDIPPRLDPQGSVSLTASRIIHNVFDTLIRMDPFDNSILEPELAVSWERISDSELELTLREGVVFHNGDPFTSEDVKFSLERVLGDNPVLANARALLSVIDRVETPGPHTVRVITKNPDPVLEYRLASLWGAWMLPADYTREHGDEHFDRNPIGTGPFRVTHYSPDRVELEAFEHSWREQPNVSRVEYRLIPEASGRLTALINNEVDLINPVLPDQIQVLAGYENVEVQCEAHHLIHLLTYNTANPVMADRQLRQAINLAIDRELIVEALWDFGASVTHGHQFEDYGPMFLEDLPLTPFDPERARELVEASSYGGETLYYDLIPGYYDNDLEAAEAVIEMLSAVGINAEVRATTRFWQNEDRAIHPWSYALRFPDPVGGLWLLFGEFSQRQATGVNDWVDPDPRFNELGHLLASTSDVDRRREVWREMHEIWVLEAPGTTLWRPAICTGVNASLDWRIHPNHTMDFSAEGLSFRD
jgi:peptide/nickel transport system substrate-binding protein